MSNDDHQLVGVLTSKNAKFFHAINYADFLEYARQRSILSRLLLSDSFHGYTQFFSDQADKNLGAWERTFGNLNDFGKYFWKQELSSPNAYGPITLVLDTNCWISLSDIHITKRTITNDDDNEVISADQLDDAFEKNGNNYYLKKGYTALEVSTGNSRISLEHLAYVLVDPIIIAGRRLREHVIEALPNTGANDLITDGRLIERTVKCSAQEHRIEQLLNWARKLEGKLISNNEPLENTLPDELKAWFDALEPLKKNILASWLTYTYNGTLQWIEK